MPVLFFIISLAVAVCGLAVLFLIRLNALSATVASPAFFPSVPNVDRYRPMLRLLSEADLAPVRGNKALLRKVRSHRSVIFRGYIRSLSRDYAHVLTCLAFSALQSKHDRPDLAKAILRSRLMFAAALCRLDLMVVMYRFGICPVDVSGLAVMLDALRPQTTLRRASPALAA